MATGVLQNSIDLKSSVNSIAFLPDSSAIASVGGDRLVHVWDVATGKEIRRFPGHQGAVYTVAVEKGGKLMASAGQGGVIHLWDWNVDEPIRRLNVGEPISTILFSPTEKLLACAAYSGAISLWNLEDGKELRRWVSPQGETNQLSMAFSSDGKTLLTIRDRDSTVRRWEVASGKEIDPIGGHTSPIASLRFSADGKSLTSSCDHRRYQEWDVATKKVRRELLCGDLRPPLADVKADDFSPDGTLLAIIGPTLKEKEGPSHHIVDLWDTETVKQVRSLKGHTDTIRWVTFSTEGKLIASSGDDGTRVWDVASGKQLMLLKVQGRPAFSPGDKLLACALRDQTTRLFDLVTGKEVHNLGPFRHVPSLSMHCLVFSADGKRFAAAAAREAAVWSTESGKELMRLEGDFQFRSLSFSASSNVLTAGGYRDHPSKDGEFGIKSVVRSWEVHSGEVVQEFDSPQGVVKSIAHSPNGRILATGGEDSTILLWDLAGHADPQKIEQPTLNEAQLAESWSDLERDASKAYSAVWSLALSPKSSLPYLQKRLQLLQAPANEVEEAAQRSRQPDVRRAPKGFSILRVPR